MQLAALFELSGAEDVQPSQAEALLFVVEEDLPEETTDMGTQPPEMGQRRLGDSNGDLQTKCTCLPPTLKKQTNKNAPQT